MPKEVVFGEQTGVLLREDFTPDPNQPPPIVPIVEVRWSRNQHVQVVSKATDPHDGRVTDDAGVHYTDGFHVDLDRHAINQLIRNLRRARDQAFGRDE
jgi:hypothetical protein